MSNTSLSTRDRIIQAAGKLFYGEGIRAVSVDAVAEKPALPNERSTIISAARMT